jgi:hypothetical protein
MKQPFNISIPTPCHEKFENFSPTAQGGFCNTCSKEVIDFTRMTSKDIYTFFEKHHTKNICGRFKHSQLQTYHSLPKQPFINRLTARFAIAVFALFAFQNTQAQTINNTSPNNSSTSIHLQKKGKLIKGTVKDKGTPLPGVNIYLSGTSIGTTTNFEGYFEFPQPLNNGDVLVFNYIGYKTQKVIVDHKTTSMNIALDVDLEELQEIVIVGKVATKKVYKSKQD